MPLPINMERLLSATSIDSSRIEYKKEWNPDAIYRSICAFANDSKQKDALLQQILDAAEYRGLFF